MFSNIEVERNIDEFNKEKFSFYYNDYILYLDSYELFNRKTKKHSFKRIKWYSRLYTRDCNLKESDVVLSEDIINMAKNEVISRLEVKFWNEK